MLLIPGSLPDQGLRAFYRGCLFPRCLHEWFPQLFHSSLNFYVLSGAFMATLFTIIGIDDPSSPRTLSLPCSSFLLSTMYHIYFLYLFCLSCCLLPPEWKKSRDFCPCCWLLYPQHLVQCLAHSRSLINICHILESWQGYHSSSSEFWFNIYLVNFKLPGSQALIPRNNTTPSPTL